MASSETVNRRDFFRASLALPAAALFGCGPSAPGPRSTRRPNILFAFADDQSWPHASAYGDKVVKTPAFDRVAREGVLFSHSYTACPSCTASRGAVLSGQQIWRIREAGVLYGTMPPDIPLYPLLLEDAGYHVGYTGKGFLPSKWDAAGLTRYPTGGEFNERRMEGPTATGIDLRDYAANFDDFLAARPAGTPFCFWFGSTEPHRIYEDGVGLKSGKKLEDVSIPAYWPDSAEIRSDILDYYFEIEWFDSHVARMLAKLEQIGELDNTLIIVTSDNGMPFPRAKVNLYDAGVRMPLAIRWGDRVAGGRIIEDFVSHTDFAPTFLEAAGLAAPEEMTGRSLAPMLTSGASGRIESARDKISCGFERHTWCRPDGASYPIRTLRNREYLYLVNYYPDRWPTGGPEFVSSNKTFHGDVDACPTKTFLVDPENQKKYAREYELCFGKRPAEELYEIASDPDQVNNLAADPELREVKEKLRAELDQYLAATSDPRMEGREPWQDYVYHQTTGYGATYNKSLPEAERDEASRRPGN